MGKLAQWQRYLSELDVDVVQGANAEHQAAKALFSLQTDGTGHTSLKDELMVFVI